MTTVFYPSPHWRAAVGDGLLVFHAGADHLFALEDLEVGVAHELEAAFAAGKFDLELLSPAARSCTEQLLSAHIITTEIGINIKVITLRWVGTPADDFIALLSPLLASHNLGIVPHANADLMIFLRTTSPLRDLLNAEYATLDTPHLLLDMAYHHTISLGPLVFPGNTACFGCLVERLSALWGDAEPPARPAITLWPQLAASLLTLEVSKIVAGEESLINRTVSYDFEQRCIREHGLYRLPWCPVCGEKGREVPAAFALPWEKKR